MDELLTLYEESPGGGDEASVRLLFRCAVTGYRLLNNEDYMQALVDGMRMLQERSAHSRAGITKFMDADYFTLFLRSERKLLMRVGMKQSLIDEIIDQCWAAREAARRGEFDVAQAQLRTRGTA